LAPEPRKKRDLDLCLATELLARARRASAIQQEGTDERCDPQVLVARAPTSTATLGDGPDTGGTFGPLRRFIEVKQLDWRLITRR